ncbi:MAG: hypothetical protein JOY96_03045, partial [Verrucomicrobia bacterium]|nr:hypothetical protein [Verrucomicrobiota bacterium]
EIYDQNEAGDWTVDYARIDETEAITTKDQENNGGAADKSSQYAGTADVETT